MTMPMPMMMKRSYFPPSVIKSENGSKINGHKVHKSVNTKDVKENEELEEEDEFLEYSEDDVDVDSLSYNDYYNCMPPPIFMLCITVAEVYNITSHNYLTLTCKKPPTYYSEFF